MIVLLVVIKAGNDSCKLSLKTTEEEASLANVTSVDATIVAVSSEVDAIFA